VELSSEVRTSVVRDTLVTAIVGVGEKCPPAWLQSITIDVISVILWGNVAFTSLMVKNWNVLSAVTEGKLLSFSASGEAHELISQADSEDRLDLTLGAGDDLFNFFDGKFALNNDFIFMASLAFLFSFFAITKSTQTLQDKLYGEQFSNSGKWLAVLVSIVLFYTSLSFITALDFNPFIYFRF
jgi:hypothetical protein